MFREKSKTVFYRPEARRRSGVFVSFVYFDQLKANLIRFTVAKEMNASWLYDSRIEQQRRKQRTVQIVLNEKTVLNVAINKSMSVYELMCIAERRAQLVTNSSSLCISRLVKNQQILLPHLKLGMCLGDGEASGE